jgi:hypothetical protein
LPLEALLELLELELLELELLELVFAELIGTLELFNELPLEAPSPEDVALLRLLEELPKFPFDDEFNPVELLELLALFDRLLELFDKLLELLELLELFDKVLELLELFNELPEFSIVGG